MKIRVATERDIPLLARLNRQLQEDERAPLIMSPDELVERMTGWLRGEYEAVLFQKSGEAIAYALYRPSEEGLYLRHFFVDRSHRRKGVGRHAIALFCDQIVPTDQVLSLEALAHNTEAIAFWKSVGFQEHTLSFRMRT